MLLICAEGTPSEECCTKAFLSMVKYRTLVVRFLDVPKKLYLSTFDDEQQAVEDAKKKLVELNGDASVVSLVQNGETRVIHRFDRWTT